MIEQIGSSAITYGIAGGAMFGLTFGFKSYIDGEEIELTKLGLTVTLAGLLGVLFEMVGYSPSPEQWFLYLFASSGLVAEVEVILKLLARGHVQQAQDRLSNLDDELEEGIEESVSAVGADAVHDGLMDQMSGEESSQDQDFVAAYERALERTEAPNPEPEPEIEPQAESESEPEEEREEEDAEPVIMDGP